MKIKNKILIILAIFMSVLFVRGTCSFASSDRDSLTITMSNGVDVKFTNKDVLAYNVFYLETSSGPCILLGEGVFYVSPLSSANKITIMCFDENGVRLDYRFYVDSFSSFPNIANLGLGSFSRVPASGKQLSRTCSVAVEDLYYYSDYDVYFLDSSNKLTSDIAFLSSVGAGDYYHGVPEPAIVKPSFVTTVEELQTGKIDNLIIKANDFNNYEKITLSIAEITRPITDDSQVIYHNKMKSYDLYSTATFNDFTHFVIESSKLNYSFENDKEYVIYMTTGTTFSDTYGYLEPNDEILDVLYFTVGGMTTEEILQDKQDVTNNLLEEQQKTSKGIWGTIKEILSYLNPFSENFFAYKLVELILNGLKSLFIPSDYFFETFFTDMKDWFSDRLGFLFYPFELVIDILNKILNVNFSEPVFNIPDINEPFTGQKLIGATTYNLNSLLSNSVLENIHNIYLVVVDAIIIFALVNLAKRKFEEVTSK